MSSSTLISNERISLSDENCYGASAAAAVSASTSASASGNRRPQVISIAPMMDWTTRYFRYLMRQISSDVVLYTEMVENIVVDETILHQKDNLQKFLGFDESEHPVVLQLGGSDPMKMKEAARLALEGFKYDEINLNVGCPSPRVSKNCFGARLMFDPERVYNIVKEIKSVAGDVPVTVKCRLGVDDHDTYEHVQNFIKTVSKHGAGGTNEFIVHARKCFLKGLDPRQNRSVPPLKYNWVHQLANEFDHLNFSINGGFSTFEQIEEQLRLRKNKDNETPLLQGVMVGRSAYTNPIMMAQVDNMSLLYDASKHRERTHNTKTRRQIIHNCLEHFYELNQENPTIHRPRGMIVSLMNTFHGTRSASVFRRRMTNLIDELTKKSLEELGDENYIDSFYRHFPHPKWSSSISASVHDTEMTNADEKENLDNSSSSKNQKLPQNEDEQLQYTLDEKIN